MKWKCKDGRILDVKDIETAHLRNIVAMLRRKGVVTVDEFFSCAAYACSTGGDMASYAAEGELMNMTPWGGLDELEAELETRPAVPSSAECTLSKTALSKAQFKERWESDADGGGITFDDIADCAKAWGISSMPRVRPMAVIRYEVLKAAGTNDCENFTPDEED